MNSPVTPDDIKAVLPDPASSKCSAFTNILLRFPVLVYKFLNWFLDSDGDISLEAKRGVMPPGSYEFSAGELPIDGSRLICDGSAVSRTTYAGLFAVIGEIYGAGDMSTTFNLPDFRDRFPIGQSATKTLGSTGGEATHALTEAEMPPHVHGNAPPDGAQFVTQGWAIGTQNVGGGNEGDEPYSRVDASAIIAVSAGGTGDPAVVTPHPIMPPWLSCFIYVRT